MIWRFPLQHLTNPLILAEALHQGGIVGLGLHVAAELQALDGGDAQTTVVGEIGLGPFHFFAQIAQFLGGQKIVFGLVGSHSGAHGFIHFLGAEEGKATIAALVAMVRYVKCLAMHHLLRADAMTQQA